MTMKISRISCFLLAAGLVACASSAQTSEPISPTQPTEDTPAIAQDTPADALQTAPATQASTTPATQASAAPATQAVATSGSKEEVLERVRAMLEQFITAVQSTEGDCDAMADSLAVVIDDHRDLGPRIKAIESDPETRAWFEEQGQVMLQEFMPRMMSVLQAAQACEDNPKMQRVMEDFGSLGS